MSRLQSKSKEESTIDVMNHKLGNRLQQLAQLHAVIFTVNAFVGDIDAETHPSTKPILNDLCKLFMIGQIQRLSSPIIEAAFICPTKFALLEEEKQRIFARLRPIIVGLIDSLAIPEKYIRSQLARGHPYNVRHPNSEFPRLCASKRSEPRHSGIAKDLWQHRARPRKTTPKTMIINCNICNSFFGFFDESSDYTIICIFPNNLDTVQHYIFSTIHLPQSFPMNLLSDVLGSLFDLNTDNVRN